MIEFRYPTPPEYGFEQYPRHVILRGERQKDLSSNSASLKVPLVPMHLLSRVLPMFVARLRVLRSYEAENIVESI